VFVVPSLFLVFFIFITYMRTRRGATMCLLEAQEDSRAVKLIFPARPSYVHARMNEEVEIEMIM